MTSHNSEIQGCVHIYIYMYNVRMKIHMEKLALFEVSDPQNQDGYGFWNV